MASETVKLSLFSEHKGSNRYNATSDNPTGANGKAVVDNLYLGKGFKSPMPKEIWVTVTDRDPRLGTSSGQVPASVGAAG